MKKIVDKNLVVDNLKVESSNIIYYQANDNHFASFGYDRDSTENYHRLKDEELDMFKETSVSYHGNNSAGIHIMFETNSLNINLKAKLHDDFALANMSNYGQSAFSLYIYNSKIRKYVLYGVSRFPYRALDFEVNLATFKSKRNRKFILYFPLYATVDEAKIGLNSNSKVKPIYHKDNRKIGVYGTSITQGCDASNSGLCYTNIMSRKLDANVYNLGFSGSALMESDMARIIAKKNFDIVVIDSEANAGCDDKLKDRLDEFLDILFEANPKLKVMLCSRVYYNLDICDDEVLNRHNFYLDFLSNKVKEYQGKGYNIVYLDGSKIVKLEEISFSVDGVHPDSYVLNKIALAMVNKINKEF